MKKRNSKWFSSIDDEDGRYILPQPLQFLRECLAYWIAHSFGRRMLYPGTLSLLKAVIGNALIDGRRKHLISGVVIIFLL